VPASSANPPAAHGPLTWIVVSRQLPLYVRDNPTGRPWLTFVLERETGLLLGQDISPAVVPAAVVDLVHRAMVAPMAGPPRRPVRLSVESKAVEAALGAAFPISVHISNKPLHDADEFFEGLRSFFLGGGARDDDEPPEEPSYFADGLPREEIRELIRVGSALAKQRPWDVFPNEVLIRLDIPDLGVEGAALCIIGAMGDSRSILMFRSHDDYMIHLGRGERLANGPEFSGKLVEPGVAILALNFEIAAEVGTRMKEEAASMGLVARKGSLYPSVLCIDPDGVRRPSTERDLRILVAAAAALEELFRRLGRRVGDPDSWPIFENFTAAGSKVARLCVPFEAAALLGIDAEPTKTPPPKANDLCHCGSGRKYKACHRDIDGAHESTAQGEVGQGAVGFSAMAMLLTTAELRFPEALEEIDRVANRGNGDTLTLPWALFHRAPKDTATVAATLLYNRIGSPEVTAWITAQTLSWISAWYIADISGGHFSCRDLITGEIRVSVRADPRIQGRLARGDVFVGRIVEFQDGAEIFGVGPQTLTLKEADQVVGAVRSSMRTAQVSPEMLRSHRGGSAVQRAWKSAARGRGPR